MAATPRNATKLSRAKQVNGRTNRSNELAGKKATRIAIYKYGVNPSDEKQYPELHAWMLAQMDRTKQVFAKRVRMLRTGAAAPDEDEDPPDE
jgi:hypothetical protein